MVFFLRTCLARGWLQSPYHERAFFFFFLICSYMHNIRFTILTIFFKVHSSVVLSPFTLLYNCHHYPSPELFHLPS